MESYTKAMEEVVSACSDVCIVLIEYQLIY